MRQGRPAARCWPYMVMATGSVGILPAYVATLVLPARSAPQIVGALLLALVVSMAAARLGAALWMRHPLARDVVFADLMAWEWMRRRWLERRLARAQSALTTAEAAPHEWAETLRRLARLLEARDAYTHGHSQRVARHALRIARALHLPAADAAKVWTAATLHDIGKIRTPREILNKPGRLSDAEFAVIKRHPVDGAAMLGPMGDPEIVAIVRSHHERLDGAGYPDGLAGPDIPLGSRIIAVADTFDALTSTRSYRSGASHKRALDVLRKEAGAQLDEAAVAAFLRTYAGRRAAAWSSTVALGPQRLISWLSNQVPGVAGLAPAAGWIGPAAAAAAALTGISFQAIDSGPTRASGGAAQVAHVRFASAASLEPTARPAPKKSTRDRATAPTRGARRHPSHRRPHSPAAAPAAVPTSTPAPAVREPALPAEVRPVTDVVAAVKVPAVPPAPAVDPAALPVQAPSLPAALTAAATTTVQEAQSDVAHLISKVMPTP
jgi:putative nucleotidyltransferase with HDIG domain